MIIKILSLILSYFVFPQNGETFNAESNGAILDSVQYKIYENFENLESDLFHSDGSKVKVINFWATWCGPCVKELPLFEELNNSDDNLDIVLVSLDFKNQLTRRLDPFLEKKKMNSEVVVLADGDANKWIDMVDPTWSGTIPATLIIKGNQKIFTEQEFQSTEEIYEFINKLK